MDLGLYSTQIGSSQFSLKLKESCELFSRLSSMCHYIFTKWPMFIWLKRFVHFHRLAQSPAPHRRWITTTESHHKIRCIPDATQNVWISGYACSSVYMTSTECTNESESKNPVSHSVIGRVDIIWSLNCTLKHRS